METSENIVTNNAGSITVIDDTETEKPVETGKTVETTGSGSENGSAGSDDSGSDNPETGMSFTGMFIVLAGLIISGVGIGFLLKKKYCR